MTSSFTWLDLSERERRRTLDVIGQFRDEDTRDELGLGTIRDALADRLFPGTSTVQSRARYFLFIPWVYLDLEHQRVGSADIAAVGRQREVALIKSLLENGERGRGIIGQQAGSKVQRLPSSVYWAGLRTWGILLISRSQGEYHRWLDAYYKRLQQTSASDEAGDGDSLGSANWHPHLPDPPTGFPGSSTFALTLEEAEYLADRILQSSPDSLLAWLVNHTLDSESADMLWNHPACEALPADLRRIVERARYFSELMHGAALVYNLVLAESRPEFQVHRDTYRKKLAYWWTTVASEGFRGLAGEAADFWNVIEQELSQQVPPPTKAFVNRWHEVVIEAKHCEELIDGTDARELIEQRERSLKRGRARIGNDRLMQDWGGRSGAAQLDYRWAVASQILDDIVQPLKG